MEGAQETIRRRQSSSSRRQAIEGFRREMTAQECRPLQTQQEGAKRQAKAWLWFLLLPDQLVVRIIAPSRATHPGHTFHLDSRADEYVVR